MKKKSQIILSVVLVLVLACTLLITACEKCEHNFQNGKCIKCQQTDPNYKAPSCVHSYVNGTCEKCGATCAHSYTDGYCTKCGAACTHSYTDGGSTIEAQTVVDGEAATALTVPTKEGYTFAGWYLEDAPYSFETPVTADITLVAKWEAAA